MPRSRQYPRAHAREVAAHIVIAIYTNAIDSVLRLREIIHDAERL